MHDENIIMVDENTDLVYSPDDNGWYFQEYPSQKTSQVFPDEDTARLAWRTYRVIFGD